MAICHSPERLRRRQCERRWGRPTKLRYRRLTPNYDHYRMPDSDAVNQLDRYGMALWFLSRGDECLNCEGELQGWFQENDQPVIRVHKSGNASKL
jgi:hypothetical protein